MKTELINQINKLDTFFKPFKFNSSEEILFTLIQLMDIRDDNTVTDNILSRLFIKLDRDVELMSDKFIEDYFVHTGAFIGGFMQFFFQEMKETEPLDKALEDIATLLAEKLSKKEIDFLYNELIDKLKIVAKNKELKSEPRMKEMLENILSKEAKKEIFNLENKDFASFIMTVSLSFISIIGDRLEDTEWDIDETIDMQESLSDIENELREAINSNNFCDEQTFEYSLSDKPKCNLCQKEYKGMKRHLNSCIEKKFAKGKKSLYYLVIRNESNHYYLHISIKSTATLNDLDGYIRDVWVECCGHMSDFYVRGERGELSMDMRLKKVFSNASDLEYIYDYGTSTKLNIEFVKEFKGEQEHIIKTLTRNPLNQITCQKCLKKKAIGVCSQCIWDEEAEAYLCEDCIPKHECGEDMILPYVNSPRVGECAYGSWEDVYGVSQKKKKELEDKLGW